MDDDIFMFNAHAARVNLQRSRLHYLEPLGMTYSSYGDYARETGLAIMRFIGDHIPQDPWPIDDRGLPMSCGGAVDERWKGLYDEDAETMTKLLYGDDDTKQIPTNENSPASRHKWQESRIVEFLWGAMLAMPFVLLLKLLSVLLLHRYLHNIPPRDHGSAPGRST